MWRYFDFLPVKDRKNIINLFEGDVTIHRWPKFELLVKEKYGFTCRIYAHRQDRNYATATFKDLAGSVIASVLKENGIQQYVVSSTGNIGVAYARYLKEAGILLYVFIPNSSPKTQEAEIACFGQKVFRVNGDYTQAKEMASEFSKRHGILNAGGSFDPMRIEGKKTMVYEWLRLMPEFPTVYLQALSGGTGPLGIAKACDELEGKGFFEKRPRFILVQSAKCSPMADAWMKAKTAGFPMGWENEYPVIYEPETSIATLATGKPYAYPVIGKLVHESGGEIITFDENRITDIGRLVAAEAGARIGPAAAITVGGLLESLRQGHIRQNDVVLVNIGEGIRRSPTFLETFIVSSSVINSVDDCHPFESDDYRKILWKNVDDLLSSPG
jgi:threonine synthase